MQKVSLRYCSGVGSAGTAALSQGPRRARRRSRAVGPCMQQTTLDWVRSRSSSTCGPACGRPMPVGREQRPAGGPEGRHCVQRLGKGPVRPPGPATPRTPTKRHQTPRDLPGILDGQLRDHLAMQLAAAFGICRVGPGKRSKVAYGRRPASAPQPGGSPIPAINGRPSDLPRGHGGARGTADHRR